jgi:zinc protease
MNTPRKRKTTLLRAAVCAALLPALVSPLSGVTPEDPPSAKSLKQGKRLVARAVKAMGGAARIDAVKSLHQAGPINLNMGDTEMAIPTRLVIDYPDRMRVEIATIAGRIVRAISPDDSFVQTSQGTQPMTEEVRRQFEEQMYRDVLMVLKFRTDPEFRPVAKGTKEVEGNTVELVDVHCRGVGSTLGIDPETGHLLTISYPGQHPRVDAPGEFVTVFSDFRDVNGVMYPFSRHVSFNGEPSSSFVSESVEIDAPLDDALFRAADSN